MVNWERNRRGNGVIAAVLFLVSYIILGRQPKTTWAGDGFWAPDSGFARFVPTLVMLAWLTAVSVVRMRLASLVRAPDRVPVPTA